MRNRPHVLIVGAGPAGCAAAFFLARDGVPVSLLDRAHFPRDKACGDFCSIRSVVMLERMGLSFEATQSIENIRMIAPGGATIDAPLGHTVFGGRTIVAPRRELDWRLVQAATAAGADFRPGCRVTGVERRTDPGGPGWRLNFDMSPIGDNRRTPGQLDADFLIVADGANSQLRRWLGAPDLPVRHSAFALRQYLDGLRLPLPRTIQVFYLRELLPYYGWVFPLSESRANVGVGVAAGRLRFPERDEPGLRALLSGFLKNPLVEHALGGPAPGGQSETVSGHPLHFASGIRPARSPLVLDRAIFAGDAAGLIHPLSGEGIDFALESGELAALSIRAATDSGDFRAAGLALQAYQRHCHQRWIAPCERAARLRWLLRRPRLVDRYFRAVQGHDLRAPGPGHAAARLAGTLFGDKPRLDFAVVFRALWLPR